jgi:hypothetical protein
VTITGAPRPGEENGRPADGERLADVVHVLHGEGGAGALQRILYGVYVATILGATYGFTLARGLFATREPAVLRNELTSPTALVIAVAVVGLSLALARSAGRTRGPVVPPLPWTDLVVTTSLDRALAVRRWWRYAASGGLAGGGVLGAALGGGAWSATVGGPAWFVAGLVVGPALGWTLVLAWLSGQVASGGPPPRSARAGRRTTGAVVHISPALRRLGIDDLRRQGARSTRLGGGVLAGDLRAIRLEVAAPVTRGRRTRLRAGGPWATVVRRDVLGLRRSPGTLLAGAVVAGLGAAGVTWSLGDRAAPAALSWLAVAACYLGFGWWAEGLRLQGDNGGTTPLLGVWGRREALAHLVTPMALFVLVSGVVALGIGTLRSTPTPGTAAVVALTAGGLGPAGWLVVLGLGVAGAQLLAAFRGQPPALAFTPESGPMILALWYGIPFLVSVLGGGAATAALASAGTRAVVPGAIGALLVLWWGLSRVDGLEAAHRT